MTNSPKWVNARWASWAFGLALLVTVTWIAVHQSEERAFTQLVFRARPAWLLVGLLFQAGTYLADARIWQHVLRRASIPRPLFSFVGLGLAKLFLDQAIPSGGLSGTLLVVHGLDRRGVPRGVSMATVVIDLVSYYTAYGLALGIAFGIIWAYGDLKRWMAMPVGVFAIAAAAITMTLLWLSRGRRLPPWLERLPLVSPALRALEEATPGIAHDGSLIAQCAGLQLAIVAFDAGTLWAMLRALGVAVDPMPVFASFMLSTLARTLGVVPGGLGVFEAVSVATLRSVGVRLGAGLAATLLFRGFSFWLPMVPGLILWRRESRPPREGGTGTGGLGIRSSRPVGDGGAGRR